MIPVAEPKITENDIDYVNQALASGWISSSGRFLNMFEERWASICGMPYGIAVSNGTVALDIAVALLRLQPGDEVIMPTFTIISPAQAVIRAGGVPVLVDTCPKNWQMNIRQIEEKITSKTKAILVVHIYGHPADMDPIMDLAKQYRLKVIEDAAEVHGAEYKGHKCGGFGDISTFSFFANKIISTGEGGMLLIKDPELAERARSMRNLCFQKKRRFLHEELGYNCRFTNIQAALGYSQLDRLVEIINRKRAIAYDYYERLKDVENIELPVEEPWAKSVYWVYGLVLADSVHFGAAELLKRLEAKGIEARPFFLGMHEQPVFRAMGFFNGDRYPVAERLSRKGLYIPAGLSLTKRQMDWIVRVLKEELS